jgi:hypothetical protein
MRNATILALALAVLAGGTAATWAGAGRPADERPTRVIRACQNKENGVLRVVRKRQRCWVGERRLRWNVRGRVGRRGPKGRMGEAGRRGAAGNTGPAGARGADGAAGPAGETGQTGATGAQGETGALGPQGDAGAQGTAGPKGDTGAQGPAGPTGDTGAEGPAGPKGDTGAQGSQGPIGPEGPPDPNAVEYLDRVGDDTGTAASSRGRECTVGEIMLSASTVRAAGGVPANGQNLAISQYSALFSMFGTVYGGDGKTTFKLPDLRALAPNHMTYSICVDGVYPVED